jgi:hypothetical protein
MAHWTAKLKDLPSGVTAFSAEVASYLGHRLREMGYFATAYRLNVDHDDAVDLLAEWRDWYHAGLLDSDPIDAAEEALTRVGMSLDGSPGWQLRERVAERPAPPTI